MADRADRKSQDSSDEDDQSAAGASSADWLPKLLQKLSLVPDAKEKQRVQVLEDVSFEGIIKYIADNKCKNIIAMVGAGISTSAGIPDFRSPNSGLYSNLQKYNLPSPEAMFDIGYFKEHPEPFFKLAKELYPDKYKPTTCHYFLRLLHEKGLLLRLYTQNVDTLERVAGIPGDRIVEAHGSFYTSHCINHNCNTEYDLKWIKDKVFSDVIPSCEVCNDVVKPDIIFFGEALPGRFFECLKQDFPKCDLLFIIGTSLTVQPFAGLIESVPEETPRCLINGEKRGESDPISRLCGFGDGLDFNPKTSYRDVAWIGLCDDGCLALAAGLGWKNELVDMMKKEHELLKKDASAEQ